jgi:hypothetical protein
LEAQGHPNHKVVTELHRAEVSNPIQTTQAQTNPMEHPRHNKTTEDTVVG